MGILDGIMDFFNPQQQAAPAAAAPGPAGAPPLPPEYMQVLDSAMDPEHQKRMQIAKALSAIGQSLSSSTQDFGPALAQSLGKGSGAYLGAVDNTDELKRARAKEMLSLMLSKDKSADALSSREQALDIRKEIADARANNDTKRLDLLEKRYQTQGEQGDRRLDQSDTRLDETGRHNKAGEQGRQDALDLKKSALIQGDRRLDETERHNLATEGLGRDSLELRKGALPSGATTNQQKNLMLQARRLLLQKQTDLGLDRKGRMSMSAEEIAAAEADFADYEKGLRDELAFTGGAQTGAAPIPEPQQAAPEESAPVDYQGKKYVKRNGQWFEVQ